VLPQRFCPKCSKSYQGQMLCPGCGVELSDSRNEALDGEVAVPTLQLPPSHPSTIRRILLGCIIASVSAAGFSYLYQGMSGIFSANDIPWGFSIPLQSIPFLGVLIGALVGGMGHPRGAMVGLLLGILGGVAISKMKGTEDQILWFGLAPILGASLLGLFGGILVKVFSPPLPELPFEPRRKLAAPPKNPAEVLDYQPIPWVRIVLGALLAVAGAWYSDEVRTKIISMIGKGPNHHTQYQLIGFLFYTLMMIISGVIVSARTHFGFRNGQILGMLSGISLTVLMAINQVVSLPSNQFLLEYFGLYSNQTNGTPPVQNLIATAGYAWAICTLSSWIGAQLIPTPTRRRSRAKPPR
jgi:Na+/proline symporter